MDNYPIPITKGGLEKLLCQMNNSIYKINLKDGKYGIGFFSKIKMKKRNIPALITSYKIINQQNDISVCINGLNTKINDFNIIYKNKKYDIIIIQINEQIYKKIVSVDIDENTYKTETDLFLNESIYILHYNNKNDIQVSFGTINNLNKSEILCSCNITTNIKVLPIFNLSNNKIIGLYVEKSKFFHKGILFNDILDEIKNEIFDNIKMGKGNDNNIKRKNEIKLVVNAEKNEINKEIYFLDNIKYYSGNVEHFHDNLEELNETNVELFINDKKFKFKKYFIPEKEGKYNIKLKFNLFLKDCSYMFAGCRKIENIDLSSFNTKNVINMFEMFHSCDIKELDLSSFDTKNVIDMSYMFDGCDKLESIELFSFNTRNVRYMNGMFRECNNLKTLDLSSFDTSNAIYMREMFRECTKLKEINLYSFNTKNVEDMRSMFSYCHSLLYLDLSSFNTKNVENMGFMFYKCYNLIDINISSFDTKNVSDMSYMFYDCRALYDLDLSHFDIRKVWGIESIFYGCERILKKNLELFKRFNYKYMIKKEYVFKLNNN